MQERSERNSTNITDSHDSCNEISPLSGGKFQNQKSSKLSHLQKSRTCESIINEYSSASEIIEPSDYQVSFSFNLDSQDIQDGRLS